jgi:hypothetical protein
MANLKLKTKLTLLHLIPYTLLGCVSTGLLTLLETKTFALYNGGLFLFTIFFIHSYLQDYLTKLERKRTESKLGIETIEFSTRLLLGELAHFMINDREIAEFKKEISVINKNYQELKIQEEAQEAFYLALKNLVQVSLREAEKAGPSGRSYILLAKELAAICRQSVEIQKGMHTTNTQTDQCLLGLKKLMRELDEKILHADRPLIIADGILINAERVSSQLVDASLASMPQIQSHTRAKRVLKPIHKKAA